MSASRVSSAPGFEPAVDAIPALSTLPPDRMSTAERMRALLTPGSRPDRVPFVPFATDFSARNCGIAHADVHSDAQTSFLAQARTHEQFGFDGGPSYGLGAMGAWEFGGGLKLPTRDSEQAPSVARYPVMDEDDVDRLRLPHDVLEAGSIPMMLAFSRLQDRAGGMVTVQLGSVFTSAANMVPLGTFLRWMIKRPDLVHHLLRLMASFYVEVARRWTEVFPGRAITAFDGGPTEANHLISPKQFREFALPYAREVHEKALAFGVTRFHTHACGEQNANLPAYREIPFGRSDGPPGMMSFGHEIRLRDAIETLGDHVIIAGNVEPTLLQTAEPETVWEVTRDAVLEGKEAPLGYVLATGCSVPTSASPYNLFIMVKAAKRFGQYG